MAMFGFGQQDPYAEAEQAAQDRQTAFAGMKDNLPALGLIAGLSMLARNNGTRSVGQLMGQAGGDALNAYSTFQKMEEAQKRQKQLDEERAEEREYGRSQDAIRNDMAERRLSMEQAKMAQDMAMQRQRLGMAAAELALRRQNALAGDWALSNGVLINKKTGELRQLTPEQLQQMQAAGGVMDYDPNDPEVKKFKEEMGKRGADEFNNIRKAGMSAYDTLDKMQQVKSIMDSGLYTGVMGDWVQGFRKFGASFGLSDAQAAAYGELLDKTNKELALMMRNPDMGLGMPGSMSDSDRKFIVSAQPGLTTSAAGNRLMAEMGARIAQRRIDIAAMADEYQARKGKLDKGFYDKVREYSNKNPMFAGLELPGGGQKKNRRPLSDF